MAEPGEADNDSDVPPLAAMSEVKTAEHTVPAASPDAKRWKIHETVLAAIITAVVGAIVAIVVALIDHTVEEVQSTRRPFVEESAIPTYVGGPPAGPSTVAFDHTPGSIGQVEVKGVSQGLKVSGIAEPDIRFVVVLVGPRSGGGQFWAAQTDVKSGTWRVTVDTPPALEYPFTVNAYFQGLGMVADPMPIAGPGGIPCPPTDGPQCFASVGTPATYKGEMAPA